jgi:uncharacterized membrane protein YebE (DUF533 family)
MSAPTWLRQSSAAPVLEALRAVAWADGSLDSAERDLVVGVVRRLGVEVSDAVLHAWLDEGAGDGPSTESLMEEDHFGLHLILSTAIRLGLIDGDYSADERARVAGWAEAWGFSAADLAEIEAEITDELAQPADPFA